MGVKTYDPKQAFLTWGAIHMSGFAEGTVIKIKRQAEMWTMQVGVDGEVTRSKSNNKSGEVEVTLMQTSDVNDLISVQALVDENTNAGAAPLIFRDGSGRTFFAAETAWLKKFPDADYSDKAGPRTYVFDTDQLVVFEGGN